MTLRFASVRHKSRPQTRIPVADDFGLIAVRYEQTAPAEPPIPFPLPPPRSPLRTRRPISTVASPPTPTTSISPTIVVPPPTPPCEQHPAFRVQLKDAPHQNDWKRDSGLGGLSSSASTSLHEDFEGDRVYNLLESDKVSSVYSSDSPNYPPPANSGPCTSDEVPRFSCQSRWSVSESDFADETTPTKAYEASKRLVRGLSLRISPMKRLRKKSLDEEGVAPSSLASPQPQSPGSSAPTPPKLPDSLAAPGQDAARNEARESPILTQSSPPYEISQSSPSEFTPINTSIPRGSFLDDDFLRGLTFSQRGSLYFGGKRAVEGSNAPPASSMDQNQSSTQAAPAAAVAPTDGAIDDAKGESPPVESARKLSLPNIRVMSVDTERESQKVRSLYESGDNVNWQDGGPVPHSGGQLEPAEEIPSDGEGNVARRNSQPTMYLSITTPRSASSLPSRRDKAPRRSRYELAGGIEDWEDVDVGDVDRYGFITSRRPESRATTPDTRSLHASLGKRKGRNVLSKRPAGSLSPLALERTPSRKVSARSLNTQASERSTTSRMSIRSGLRSAANMLPHNRDRRWMDEAGDMLSLPPGLADIEEEQKIEKMAMAVKKKEAERSEKWRKMAKVTKEGKDGEGMNFEFDTKNPKLVERTWKGIPDRWRAAAWYSFLATSAKASNTKHTEELISAEFHRLQDVSSPDDVQIDLDVPRTINRHIMFRRRYRGGQRLLFRVLHALSLYFPETGYVQGMAALAASLLCYYDEEKCFVMLVRLWQFRGLERLYQPEFTGLMAALQDFEEYWLEGKEVAKKLSELGINSTAYGTRWYLTLFNLTIPFSAQLRVWDVLMLLGDSRPPAESSSPKHKDKQKERQSPSHDFDIIHAASAALIDALKENLLDSDFENAMKALTSFVSVKDEDLLMNTVRAEWRSHQGKRKS